MRQAVDSGLGGADVPPALLGAGARLPRFAMFARAPAHPPGAPCAVQPSTVQWATPFAEGLELGLRKQVNADELAAAPSTPALSSSAGSWHPFP